MVALGKQSTPTSIVPVVPVVPNIVVCSNYRSGEYYQLINIQHHLLDDSPHSIQVHLSVEGTGGGSSSSGNVAPNSGIGNSTNPIDLFQEPGFVAGVVVSIVCLCVVAVVLLLCRKCCNCCCKPSRRNQFEKANKKKGTPSTKFSKITVNDDDDDDDLDGLELAQTSFSSKNNNNKNNTTNEFGIVRSQRSDSRIPLQLSSSSSSSSSASLGLKLVSGVVLDPDEFETTWQAMDLTKLWGSTLKVLPTEQEWEDLLAANFISCMASGQVEDTQKFYFYATDSYANLYLVEASITKSSKRLACVFKTSSTPNNNSSGGDANTKLLNEFIDFFRNRIVGYLTRL